MACKIKFGKTVKYMVLFVIFHCPFFFGSDFHYIKNRAHVSHRYNSQKITLLPSLPVLFLKLLPFLFFLNFCKSTISVPSIIRGLNTLLGIVLNKQKVRNTPVLQEYKQGLKIAVKSQALFHCNSTTQQRKRIFFLRQAYFAKHMISSCINLVQRTEFHSFYG